MAKKSLSKLAINPLKMFQKSNNYSKKSKLTWLNKHKKRTLFHLNVCRGQLVKISEGLVCAGFGLRKPFQCIIGGGNRQKSR